MDKNNNVITIDGVRYKLAPADWNLHQQILSRATVLNDDNAPQDKSDIKPVTPAKNITPEEKLTDDVVKRLVGHTNVVYYNFETKAWNTNTYNGYPIDGQKTDTGRAHDFKVAMEREPEFRAQYEMVASVTMTIDRKFYPGWTKTISNPVYSAKGTAVVGNIIAKNKTTGEYELYCKSWVGVYDFYNPPAAVDEGADGFTLCATQLSDYRATLIAAHTR